MIFLVLLYLIFIIYYLLFVNNDYKYFIFLKNGCQVNLDHLFYQNNFSIINVGSVQDDIKSNIITYAHSLQNSNMTINYESIQLDYGNVYFEYIKYASFPTLSHSNSLRTKLKSSNEFLFSSDFSISNCFSRSSLQSKSK
jgi:hypothetical protein